VAVEPNAPQLSLADFIEVATLAALRAVDAHNKEVALNPQPLPPGQAEAARVIGRRPIIIGIIADPGTVAQ
jgi:hypothetical protein